MSLVANYHDYLKKIYVEVYIFEHGCPIFLKTCHFTNYFTT